MSVDRPATRRGYNIILCNTNEESKREEEALNLLREKRVDGILITPVQKSREYLKALAELDIPFVLVNRHPQDYPTDYVVNDNVAGGCTASRRLIAIGRRRLAYISGPATISSVQERLAGCRGAIEQEGLQTEIELTVTTVKQPRYRIGSEAAAILIDKLEGESLPEYRCIVLQPGLVVRLSA